MAGSEAFQSIPPRKTRPSKALRGQKSRKSHSAFASFSPRSTRLVYHRFKPRALSVNCTPRCTVMPDGDIAFSRLATANQCAGNWPSNGRACIFFLASLLLFSPLERKVFDRWFTGVWTSINPCIVSINTMQNCIFRKFLKILNSNFRISSGRLKLDTFGEILNFLFRREESMDSRFNFDYDVKLRIHRNHHSYCGKKYKLHELYRLHEYTFHLPRHNPDFYRVATSRITFEVSSTSK